MNFNSGEIYFLTKNKLLIRKSTYAPNCLDCYPIQIGGCSGKEYYQDTISYFVRNDTIILKSQFTPEFLSKFQLYINECPSWPSGSIYRSDRVNEINYKLQKTNDTLLLQVRIDSFILESTKANKLTVSINNKLFYNSSISSNNELVLIGNTVKNVKDTLAIKIDFEMQIGDSISKSSNIFTIRSPLTKQRLEVKLNYKYNFSKIPYEYFIIKEDQLSNGEVFYRRKIIFR